MFKTMPRTSRLFTWASLGCLLLASSSQASTLLLGWDFTAAGAPAATTGAAVTVGSTTNDPGIQAGTIDAGLGLYIAPLYWDQNRGAMNDQNGGGRGWTAADLAAATTGNDYFQWAIAPASGYQMSLSSLDLVTYQQNSNATATVVVEYSLDGFATAGTSVGTINPVNSGWYGTATNLSLAGFANLQNATATVTFRAYGYGFGNYEDKGLGQIPGNNTDVGINGTAVSIPEPASLGLGLLGLGIIALGRRRTTQQSV